MAKAVSSNAVDAVPAESLDVAAVIAAHIAGMEFESLSSGAVEAAKRSILDTVGVIVAAGTFPGVAPVVDIVREQGGVEEATILGYGDRVPAAMAAFANGAMAHCVDYDDFHYSGLHPSTPTVPSALAMAEKVGASGKQLVTAIALANDFAVRLAESHEWRLDAPGLAWYTTPLFGYFTATAAAGKVLGLDADQLFNALGIAFCQVGGTLEMIYSPGSYVGGLNAAWPNKCGILSALMAERGVLGVPTAFEGRLGLYSMFFRGEYARDVLTDGLGERFRGEEVSFKPWPACGGTHCAIDAALQVVSQNDIAAEDVREVTVTVQTRPGWDLCTPIAARSRPTTIRDAKLSLLYAVAVAVANRRVTLADYTLETLEDERIIAMAAKVRPIYAEGPRPDEVISPATVTVVTDKGSYARTVERSRGRWPDGMEQRELADKFRDCLSYSVQPFSAGRVDKVIDIVERLEDLDDVRQLTTALRGGE
jgi:2-methylcitrate dehydratase PrpD